MRRKPLILEMSDHSDGTRSFNPTGLALVVLQAMAMDLPSDCDPNTGAEDLVEDGVHGFIVPRRCSAAAARRLRQRADATELRSQMGARASGRRRGL
jgi:glycosyltransferase involved in cell wall biosynthesis